ncbi:MAG: T9SS type A sorting domain-containing protein, partial [Candidatus Cloacimonetes bacterium]|nr:T9SS type A sorting domain-containing protein [Candidatus Cloacimonadota bacterium]
WHNTDLYDADYPYAIREVLRDYVALGGNLLYTGYSPTKAFELNAGYPVYFDADTYINSVFGISGANYSSLARFNGAISQMDELDDFSIDPDKTIPIYEGHISRVEALYPAPGAQVWYTYGSNYNPDTAYGEFQGEAVAIYNEHGLGKSAIFSFPIYATSPGPQIVQILHTMFGESVSNDDALAPVSPGLQISGNFPNPFVQSTSLSVKGAADGVLRMKIYNLRGQLVRTLDATKSGEYNWDGKDDTGRSVSSGIYFARIRHGGKTAQRKMLKLK